MPAPLQQPHPTAPSVASTPDGHAAAPPVGRRLALLTLGALGVVYGDIGTSPLYTIKEAFGPEHGLAPTAANVLGVLALVLWTLILVVVVKYITFVLRADHEGEGGILALLALVPHLGAGAGAGARRVRAALAALGVFGAALLYGDGVITPPVSVLGAMEGLAVAAPALQRVVVPVTVATLLALFLGQRTGTGRMGAAFGPVMLLWFATIGVLGAREIARTPAVLAALNPWHGVRFFAAHGWGGVAVLGAVVLAVTGAEALYADLGHFGKRPIRLAFLAGVLPALALNYLGQGALLLRDPAAAANPFYRLAPGWALVPLIALATAAAVVASQALIAGAFSLTQQAIALGYLPHLRIVRTSEEEAGQVYVPGVNAALALGSVALVVTFKTAGALAAAYGIAVTGTMAITTVLFAAVARGRWGWPRYAVGLLAGGFLAPDLAFLGANLLKLAAGGWVPLSIAGALFAVMTAYRRRPRA